MAVGIAAVAALAYYEVSNGKVKQMTNLGKAVAENLIANEHKSPAPTSVNPVGYKNNCKDVAEASVKRLLGVDENAIAGPKTVSGNLHDFVEQRGYNKAGIEWIKGDTGSVSPKKDGTSIERVTKLMLKQFKEGDCGYVGIDWDPKVLEGKNVDESGHAFNWMIQNGSLIFFDNQPETPITDASYYFKHVNANKEIEILKLTKEAFY